MEADRCQTLAIPNLIFHPGAHLGSGADAGLARIALNLNHRLGNAVLCATDCVTALERQIHSECSEGSDNDRKYVPAAISTKCRYLEHTAHHGAQCRVRVLPGSYFASREFFRGVESVTNIPGDGP